MLFPAPATKGRNEEKLQVGAGVGHVRDGTRLLPFRTRMEGPGWNGSAEWGVGSWYGVDHKSSEPGRLLLKTIYRSEGKGRGNYEPSQLGFSGALNSLLRFLPSFNPTGH